MYSTLFYDGRCALCSKEMRLLRKLMRPDLQLVDIHQADMTAWRLPPLSEDAPESEDAPDHKTMFLSVLHLHTPKGEWKTGLDATVAAWAYTPIGWLFKPLRWPGIAMIADKVYTRWARNRACSLGYVVEGENATAKKVAQAEKNLRANMQNQP